MNDELSPAALSPSRKAKLTACGLIHEACIRLERARSEVSYANLSDMTAVYAHVSAVQGDLHHLVGLLSEYERALDAAASLHSINPSEAS